MEFPGIPIQSPKRRSQHYGESEDAGEDDAFHIEEESDRSIAAEDETHMNALVRLRESRDRMNKMRTARFFCKGRIGGTLDESAAAGGAPK